MSSQPKAQPGPPAKPRVKWVALLRSIHLYLTVFFAPLLTVFVVTGWWQTVTPATEQMDGSGLYYEIMSRFSKVHTDGSFPGFGKGHHHPEFFRNLVALMAVALLFAILTGLALAWFSQKNKWAVFAWLLLGIAIPILALYFA